LKQDNTSRLSDVNGTLTLLINGTLENGTTVSGASLNMMENFGWCWMMAVVIYMAFGI